MIPATPERQYILAGVLIDGTDAEPRRNVALAVERGLIVERRDADRVPAGAVAHDLREYSVLPGLINMHVHSVLPGNGTPFAEWMTLPDELLLLQAQANAQVALRSGVTTMRDCGGKGSLTFRLREAIRRRIVPGPRLVLSGRPLTITGGHCHFFGGEADGPEGMRQAARQVLKEGADFVKIMASGGGTPGTYPQYPSFDVDELRAAIQEAHKVGKPASCHCIAAESIARALDAGTDHVEHCTFLAPDETVRYDETLARRVADSGAYVTATLQVMGDLAPGLKVRHAQGASSTDEAQVVARAAERVADHLATIGHLHELGVPLVAGNDAGWRNTGFDDFSEELEYLTLAGLSALDAIRASTSVAADACRLGASIGSLRDGRVADLIAVGGDPTTRLSALKEPTVVIQAGDFVVDRR
jgi:imidazolonepropionase-like amidohydrolase